MKKKFLLLLILSFVMSGFAGITGKIKGYVKDENGEPLAGANVVLDGTSWGAETDEDGYYYIIGIRAGTYTLKCMFIGYREAAAEIKVKADLTQTLDLNMVPSDYILDEVEFVVAKEARINKSKTTSSVSINMDQVGLGGQVDVEGILKKQGGIKTDADGELHFRGGRSGEVSYNIDGISISDPTSNVKQKPIDIDFASIQSFDIQKGVPNAEYGNALSGNVNIVYKIGDQEKTSGNMKYATDAFMGDNKFDLQNGYFSINGPFPFFKGKNKPTYFLSTGLNMENGFARSYRDWGNDNDDYYEWDDYDLTGFGFKIPQKRINNFNLIFKTAWDVTDNVNLTFSYTQLRNHSYQYDWFNRYSPQTAGEVIDNSEIYLLNIKHVLDQNSYYNLIFNYYHRSLEVLPLGGIKPDEVVPADSTDNFRFSDDRNNNYVFDNGDYEGFTDRNSNGYFDREFFIDENGNDRCDEGEKFFDSNFNNIWDGDYFDDSNNNHEWDYWDNGKSYTGFFETSESIEGKFLSISGTTISYQLTDELVSEKYPGANYITQSIEGKMFEGYEDVNGDGHYVQNLYDNNADNGIEPFMDGDLWVDSGEPFIDEYRWYDDGTDPEGNRLLYYRANGSFDEATPMLEPIIVTAEVYNPIAVRFGLDTITTADITIRYPAEEWCDLASSRGSSSQTTPSLNEKHDAGTWSSTSFGYSPKFDEFEAYCSIRVTNNPNEELGWVVHPNENAEIVHYRGTYVEYKAPRDEYISTTSYVEGITKDQGIVNGVNLSTWTDQNGDGTFTTPNLAYDAGESFIDYNYNGEWNLESGFAKPNSQVYTNYTNNDINVYKMKFDYTNQINKQNLIKTGIEFVYNDFEYYTITGVHQSYNPDAWGHIEGDKYPYLGSFKTVYNYQPVEFSFYVQDKMEFEDLVLNAGVRYDMRRHDDEAIDFYNDKRDDQVVGYEDPIDQYTSRISPRFGVSHSITETSKLFFSYGHMYQLPQYTQVYDPDNKPFGDGSTIIGNMNLDYYQNVNYELGVENQFGEYLVEFNGYFKDIYDMIQTRTVERSVFKRSIWVNSDYGKSRGLELKVEKSLNDNYLWNLSYALAYAYGKSSSATDNNENEDNIQRKETPLDWDERHSINAGFSIVYGKDDKLFGIDYLDNWSLSLNTEFGSGKPFTPNTNYFLPKIVSSKDIERNSERMPWTESTELSFIKTFALATEDANFGNVKFQFDIYNLFNKINVNRVYADTGKWNVVSDAYYEDNPDEITHKELFADPTRIDEKRHYKFTVSYQW
jgi:outer membrane receptor protein involved in Fe transport